jgi:hypothetical protein
MRWSFTEHPASVGETYLEHLCTALGFAGTMLRGSVACAVHAVLPFLFVRTGSETIRALHQRMIAGRARAEAVAPVEHLLGAGI